MFPDPATPAAPPRRMRKEAFHQLAGVKAQHALLTSKTWNASLNARNACKRYCSFQNRSSSKTHARG